MKSARELQVLGLLNKGTGGGEAAAPPLKLGFWGGGGGGLLWSGNVVEGEATGLEAL